MRGAVKIRWPIPYGSRNNSDPGRDDGTLDYHHTRRCLGANIPVHVAKAIENHAIIHGWDHICTVCVFGTFGGCGGHGLCKYVGTRCAQRVTRVLWLCGIGRDHANIRHCLRGGVVYAPQFCGGDHIQKDRSFAQRFDWFCLAWGCDQLAGIRRDFVRVDRGVVAV